MKIHSTVQNEMKKKKRENRKGNSTFPLLTKNGRASLTMDRKKESRKRLFQINIKKRAGKEEDHVCVRSADVNRKRRLEKPKFGNPEIEFFGAR